MSTYQYRVIPAPTKGVKAKGIRGPEARFSNMLEGLMNEMGADGWEYQRAEMLPSVERSGLTGSTTEWRNVLVFRRPFLEGENTPEIAPIEDLYEEDEIEADEVDEEHPAGGDGATHMLADNGVEELSEVAGMTDSLKALATRRSTGKTET